MLVITIWLTAAIKASHEKPSMQTASVEVGDHNQSPGGILQTGVLNIFLKFS